MTSIQQQARALGDPTRHGIFQFVAGATGGVGVADLADHFQLHHNAIRQHLAKLVDASLLDERTAPPDGPGRPRLVYRVDPTVGSRWGQTGPYERLSVLLSEIIAGEDDPMRFGRQAGRQDPVHGVSPDDVVSAITERIALEGFEPEVDTRDGGVDIVLRNCPFALAASTAPGVVCPLHRGLVEGMIEDEPRVSVSDLVAEDPEGGGCRIRLELSAEESAPS
jgi:predicted ArsR family transcriptional regulator